MYKVAHALRQGRGRNPMEPINANTRLGSLLCACIAQNPYMGPAMRQQKEYYTIVYLLDGQASYRDANGFSSPLRPGDLMIVFPDFAHNYNALPGGHWKPMWFTFDRSVFAPWTQNGLLDPATPVHHLEPMDYWYKRFRDFFDSFNSRRPAFPMLSVVQFQEILLQALHSEERGAVSPHDLAWAEHVCSILAQETASPQPLSQIAQTMDLSYDTFRRRFARIVGISPQQYRNRSLIERACRLMRETNLNNKEIAYRLGFYDEFHFSHRFKRIVGRSTSDYRKTLPMNMV